MTETETEMEHWRPRRRADCAEVPRPCPYVACRYNLFLDVRRDGRLVLRHGDKEPDEVHPAASCALDVADAGPRSVTDIGRLLHVTTARISQTIDRVRHHLRVLHEQDDVGPDDFGPTVADLTSPTWATSDVHR